MENIITIAIHSPNVAANLKRFLEKKGVNATLEEFYPLEDDHTMFTKLNIDVADIAKALKILENEADYQLALVQAKLAGMSDILLVPVDFSTYSEMAVAVAFDLAERLSLQPHLLHSLVIPYFKESIPYTDSHSIDISDAKLAVDFKRKAEDKMNALVSKVNENIRLGNLPDIKFSYEIVEGIPEEMILNYSRQNKPNLIVMATRGSSRRTQELIGSVTAEVLDSCRAPLFIVPENVGMPKIKEVDKVLFFCNLDNQDLSLMEGFQRMFDFPVTDLYMIPLVDSVSSSALNKLDTLENYFRDIYHSTTFSSVVIPNNKSFDAEFDKFLAEKNIQLLVVPNKKRNVFARLFNPSMAHKLFFEKDLPMLALPV
jgi:nucleotide-binding universal stress UspA family protein